MAMNSAIHCHFQEHGNWCVMSIRPKSNAWSWTSKIGTNIYLRTHMCTQLLFMFVCLHPCAYSCACCLLCLILGCVSFCFCFFACYCAVRDLFGCFHRIIGCAYEHNHFTLPSIRRLFANNKLPKNERRRAYHKPKYDQEFPNVDQCQSACLNQVPQCNTVNFSPYVSSRWPKSRNVLVAFKMSSVCRKFIFSMCCPLYSFHVMRRGKQGKCQFEYCESGYKFGGTKLFNSYIYVGRDDVPILPGTWISVIAKRQKPTTKNTVGCPFYFCWMLLG